MEVVLQLHLIDKCQIAIGVIKRRMDESVSSLFNLDRESDDYVLNARHVIQQVAETRRINERFNTKYVRTVYTLALGEAADDSRP